MTRRRNKAAELDWPRCFVCIECDVPHFPCRCHGTTPVKCEGFGSPNSVSFKTSIKGGGALRRLFIRGCHTHRSPYIGDTQLPLVSSARWRSAFPGWWNRRPSHAGSVQLGDEVTDIGLYTISSIHGDDIFSFGLVYPNLVGHSNLSRCSNRVKTTCLLVSSISPARKTSSNIA